jgi:hypothetical protein
VSAPIGCSYIVPVRWSDGGLRRNLADYLARIARLCGEVIVVDGSDQTVFAANAKAWSGCARHIRPDPSERWLNGKVAGVRTGIRGASFERIIIADDDVRYDEASLRRTIGLLGAHELVCPQNYFDPLTWHARWDTARTLLNRCIGGDFPGTLAIRRTDTVRNGYYDGNVLFENLELIRTVQCRRGRIAAPLDLYVARLPPTARHFLGQRVRQAYDDFALPLRMAAWLAILPLALSLARQRRLPELSGLAILAVAAAERGRRLSGGTTVFPAISSALAPAWLLERGVCSWLALGQRLRHGGIRYAGSVITTSAHSPRQLRRHRRNALARAGR